MPKTSWRTLRAMDQDQLKDECKRVSIEIEKLSNYIGVISNDEDHNRFLDDFGDVLDHLHGVRHAIESLYFNNIK